GCLPLPHLQYEETCQTGMADSGGKTVGPVGSSGGCTVGFPASQDAGPRSGRGEASSIRSAW
ncbi:MAG TPA: hypothetical protein VGR13_03970, partial [Actinomycetota bacterium]|nr:hypothetical protein [Actinomycetota bacterium]